MELGSIESLIKIAGLLSVLLVLARATIGTVQMATAWTASINSEKQRFSTLEAQVKHQIKWQTQYNRSSWTGCREFQIVHRSNETLNSRICSFYLAPTDGQPLANFRPGQFLTIEIVIPNRQYPLLRCYSISSGSREGRHYRITIRKLERPVGASQNVPNGLMSSIFHDHLKTGTVVNIRPPSGSFRLRELSQRPVVLIAGGVGITPLFSMIESLIQNKTKREIRMFYGVRDRYDHAMYEALKAIQQTYQNIRIFTFYSRPSAHCQIGTDFDFTGRITAESVLSLLDCENPEYYICGPSLMMETVTRSLNQAGVPEQDIMTEQFSSTRMHDQSTLIQNNTVGSAQGVTIRFARSKKTVKWTPSINSILELAELNGIKAPFGCRAGACGSCKSKLQHGVVTYTRKPATEPEPGSCLLCVTRPESDIVIDL